MPEYNIKCPNCLYIFTINGGSGNKKYYCPNCNKEVKTVVIKNCNKEVKINE